MSPSSIAIAAVVAGLVAIGAGYAWWAGGPRGRPWEWATPVRVLVLGYLVLYGIGAVAIAAAGESVEGALLIGAGFVGLGIGVGLVRRLVGSPESLPPTSRTGPLRSWVVIALAALGLLMYASLAVDHGIPLLAAEPLTSRAGWAGIRLDAFRWLVPPAALVALAVALVSRRRDAAMVAGVAVLAVIALEALAASRALVFELGAAAVLVAWWAGTRPRLRAWLVVAAMAAILFVGILLARGAAATVSGPLDTLELVVERTIGRVVLIGPGRSTRRSRPSPDQLPYLGGSSYLRWIDRLRRGAAAGARHDPVPRLFPDEPPGGFAAPGVLAEGYANFGPLFALLLMVGLGGRRGTRTLARPRPGRRAASDPRRAARDRPRTDVRDEPERLPLTCARRARWWILVAGPCPVRGVGSGVGRRADQRERAGRSGDGGSRMARARAMGRATATAGIHWSIFLRTTGRFR